MGNSTNKLMNNEKYRVLILDDDYEIGELLKEFLQNTSKCAVTYINSEPDLWDHLAQDSYDILFLDYKLPEANGLDILSQMGQRGYNIPTVMMTGEGSENVAAKSIQYGALDYLVKGEYSFTSLPPLIQKAVRLREMQKAMQQYLDQIRYQATLLNNMRDAVVVWDLDGKISYWNSAAERLYSRTAAERLGKSVYEVYFTCFDPPIELPDLFQTDNYSVEHRYLLPDQTTLWVSSHITSLTSEGEQGAVFTAQPAEMKPFGFMSVARDITPRKQEQEELVKSQHFIQRILDTSPNIIYILNLNSRRISYINPEVKAILGYPVEDFLNLSYETLEGQVHPDDLRKLEEHLQSLTTLGEGEVTELEYRFRSSRNEWRWLKTRETVFSRDDSATPTEVIGVIQDITANKLAEGKLQQRLNSEKLLSRISNHFLNQAKQGTDQAIRDAMLLVSKFVQVDLSMVILFNEGRMAPYHFCRVKPNHAAREVLTEGDFSGLEIPWLLSKLKRQEIVVVNHVEQLPESPYGEREMFQQMKMASAIFIPMVYNKNLYGILMLGTAQAGFRWNQDHVYMLQTFAEMITNAMVQKQVDQALRKSEARYRAIVEDHQTEMICRFLPNTTLTFVNEAYCRYYKKDRSQLIGTSFLNPTLDEDRDTIRTLLGKLSIQNPVSAFEQRVKLQGGEIRWLEWTSRAIFDQHTDFIEFQAVGRDITERKEMEEQIKTAQTRLTQAARLASIGELASGVAHQISNPLTTIIADAQILTHQLEPKHPGRESVEAIVKAGWRAQQVINELMKFSQPAHNSQETVSINETIENALLLAEAHIQASGIKLVTDLSPELPLMTANPRQLSDLWVNLLLLARSASDDGERHTIRIRSREINNSIQVEISDDGRPIPKELFEKIFEPQLIPTGSGRGTGMELSICREIVRQNRGQISVSGNGSETIFRISFSLEGKQ